MRLDSYVEVTPRFHRSVRVDIDLGSPSALDGFLCTHSFARALSTLAESVRGTGHGAYTWTGPYGGGKSVLALALASLIGPKSKQRSAAEAAVGDKISREVSAALRPGTRGWLTLPVLGARAPVHTLVWEALRAARLTQVRSGARPPNPREVAQIITRVSRRDTHSGLLIIIDELGKVLEGAASAQGDLHFLQEIGELASRSDGRLLILGVLHQAFGEYAARLGKQAHDEWAKIQGRFIDVPLSPASSEQLELLARAIKSRGVPKAHHDLTQRVASAIRKHRPDTPTDLASVLVRCWPLHPVTACLLGPISRRRFGQNQRSLFAFLTSREPAGFQDFLRGASIGDLFGPDRLFDYLQLNLEPAILASPDGHRWSLAIDAIERAERRGAEGLEVALLKSITLLDLFRERSGLFASRDILYTLAADTRKVVDGALERMKQWSVVAYREHLGSYAVYAGSDFDLEAALENARERVREADLKVLRQLANLRPIVAKRHYDDTGAFRWFDIDIVSPSELRERIGQFSPGGSVGQILVVIPDPRSSDRSLRTLAEDISAEAPHPCLVGVCGSGGRVPELTVELLELEHIRSSHPQLRDDMVARREVDARHATATHLLEDEIRAAFSTARFYYRGQQTGVQGLSALSRYASDVADDVYCNSPRILNELLNRGAPSSNAVAAQKALLRAMVLRPGAPQLGIEGFRPERGLYDSILGVTGLHLMDGDSGIFREPGETDPGRLRPLWKATDRFLESALRGPVSAADVYDRVFSVPPFGVRAGLRPILFVAYLQSRRERFTVYVDKVLESALTDFAVDRLVMDPSSVSLRVFDPDERQTQLIEGVRTTLVRMTGDQSIQLADTTALARALVSVVRGQPQYALRTGRISDQAKSIRAALRAASDPNVLLNETLPGAIADILGRSSASLQDELTLLDTALEEISTTYGRMLFMIDERIRAELGVANDPAGDAALHHRARGIREMTGDLRLEAFATRMLSYRREATSIEGVASLAANKPAGEWSDNDLDAALLEIAALAQRFNRVEAFARVKGRPDGRHAISIVVGLDHAPVVVSKDFEITEAERKLVLEVVRQVNGLGQRVKPEVFLAALAQVGHDLIAASTEVPRVANQ